MNKTIQQKEIDYNTKTAIDKYQYSICKNEDGIFTLIKWDDVMTYRYTARLATKKGVIIREQDEYDNRYPTIYEGDPVKRFVNREELEQIINRMNELVTQYDEKKISEDDMDIELVDMYKAVKDLYHREVDT